MHSTEARRLAAKLAVLGIVVAAAAALGVPVRATYGARTTADEPQYLLTALSLAEDGDLDIADELTDQRWRDFHEAGLPEQTRPLPGGRRISPHDPLLPVLLVPGVALGGWLGAKLTLALLAGVLAVLTAWVAVRRYGVSAGVALGVTGFFGASAPLAVYGSQVYPEIPAAIAVTAAIAAATGPLRRRAVWGFAVAVVALPWLAVKYVPVAAVLATIFVVRLWRAQRRSAVLWLGLAWTGAGVVFAAVHVAVWSGLTSYAAGDHFVGGEFTAVGVGPNYLGRGVRLIGLLVDREFGLAAWQPAWLLLVPAAVWLVRRRPPDWELLVLPLAAGWLTATFVALTMQGYWFPGRQVVVVLPAAVIVIAVSAQQWRSGTRVVALLAVAGLWSYGWLVVAGLRGDIRWIVDFFTVADPWYRVWSTVLPSYLRPSPLTWALHGAWSAAAGVAAAVTWRRAGRNYEVSSVGSSMVDPDAEPEAEPDPDPDADPELEPSSSIVRTSAPSSAPHAEAPSSRTSRAPARRSERRDDTGSSLADQ